MSSSFKKAFTVAVIGVVGASHTALFAAALAPKPQQAVRMALLSQYQTLPSVSAAR